MKKINRNITKNESSFNQHIRKLSDKNSNYYDYSEFKGIPRDIAHYLSKFFKNHPKYDPIPESYKKKISTEISQYFSKFNA